MMEAPIASSCASLLRYSAGSFRLLTNALIERCTETAPRTVLSLLCFLAAVAKSSTSPSLTTAMMEEGNDDDSVYGQDPKDFDYYVHSPKTDDLPTLLSKFEVEGLDVWPWVWLHANENGPHHVFVGVNDQVLKRLMELRRESPQNNLLLVVQNENDVSDHSKILADSHCGVIVGTVELLHPKKKIIMLSDERIIVFDTLNMI